MNSVDQYELIATAREKIYEAIDALISAMLVDGDIVQLTKIAERLYLKGVDAMKESKG